MSFLSCRTLITIVFSGTISGCIENSLAYLRVGKKKLVLLWVPACRLHGEILVLAYEKDC